MKLQPAALSRTTSFAPSSFADKTDDAALLPVLPRLPPAARLKQWQGQSDISLGSTPLMTPALSTLKLSPFSTKEEGYFDEALAPSRASSLRDKERTTRTTTSSLAAAYGALSAGGKLVAAIGATFLGSAITSNKTKDYATGGVLTVGGVGAAIFAAAMCFGPHAKAIYPESVTKLKAVAYSGTGLLAAGGLVGQLGIDNKELALIATGWALSGLGAGLISVSFRNFVSMCELNAGRVFVDNRQTAAQALGAVGAGSLAAYSTFGHQVEIPGPARSVMHALMLSAILGSYALSSSEHLRAKVRADQAAPQGSLLASPTESKPSSPSFQRFHTIS